MKKRIAITGGIGSGKSTASKFIQDMGYPVFSCDTIYKEIFTEEEYVNVVSSTFNGIVQNGVIDKRALSGLIFEDETARKKLDLLAHPRIISRLTERMQACTDDFVFAEVPLLFEGGYENLFDFIIVITRDKSERINVILQRDGVDEKGAIAKIASQFDYDDERNSSILQAENVYLINNNSTVADLQEKVKNCIRRITQ